VGVVTIGWGRAWARGTVLAAFGLALLAAACGHDGEGDARGGRDGGAADVVPAVRPDTPLGKAAAALRPALGGGSWREPLESVLAGWTGPRQPMTDLIRETYRRREHRPVFLDGLWPNEAAAVMVKAVREVPSHALPQSPYRPRVVLPLYEALALDPGAAAGTLTEAPGDLDRLAELEWQMARSVYKTPRASEKVPEVSYQPLKELPSLAPLGPAEKCLAGVTVRAARGGEPAADLEAAAAACAGGGATDAALALVKLRDAIASREAQRGSLALLDALLVLAYYQWVIDFSFDVRVHPFDSLGPANRTRLPATEKARLLEAAPSTDDAAAFAKALEARVPSSPEYARARAALARYVGLMDEAAASPPAPVRGVMDTGSRGASVEALQERLALEGYLDSPADGVFSDATGLAVKRYQETHQLAPSGVVDPATLESLEVPLEWRVKQLMVALGRWRESELSRRGRPDFYVRVNVPGFDLQVVEKGATIRRHRVIVGSNMPVEDPLNDDVVWHQRRTKLFDTKITEVVINPNWIVPEIVKLEEIEPKVRANERYLVENNFKTVKGLLVQGPGETNPLGVVKFSLENTDSIYLHDTDKRWLFKEVERDFSHGCVRVDQAVELAKFVLGRQGVEAARIDARIAEKTTLPIALEAPIPVFIEYCTVGFEDDGAPVFYRDIYDHDVAYWKRRTPIRRKFP
jgi:murein L,D-transpeptidase YcbB/YkuD